MKPAMTTAAAEIVAIRLVGYLASDEARLARFLALTGVTPADLRARAGERGVLAAVLDYVLGDEPLLLDAAARLGLDATEIVRAATLLSGRGPEP